MVAFLVAEDTWAGIRARTRRIVGYTITPTTIGALLCLFLKDVQVGDLCTVRK